MLRVAFIILAFVNGVGLAIYLALMIVLPKEETAEEDLQQEIKIDSGEDMQENGSKKLHRTDNKKMIAGICAGMEEYFGIDISIIRLVFIGVTIFSGGLGIILYAILWFILPVQN